MLRLRHGIGQSVRLTQIYRIPASSLGQGFARYRTFATEGDKNDKNESESTKISDADVEARLKDLANLAADSRTQSKASKRSLRREKSQLRATLRREVTDSSSKKAPPKKLSPEKEDATEMVENDSSGVSKGEDGFDEALNVVRKVYGVQAGGEASKKRRRKKKADSSTIPDQANGFEIETGELSIPSEIDPQGISFAEYSPTELPSAGNPAQIPENVAQGIGMGIFSSIKKKLKGPPPGEESTFTEEQKMSETTPDESTKPTKSTPTKSSTRRSRSSTKSSPAVDGDIPKKWKNRTLDVKSFTPRNLEFQPVEDDKPLDVPKLAHNLDRVLFNPGVYELRDKRSRVYNFDPYLATIMPVDEFDFDALKDYITSSKDVKLRDLCKKHEKKYCGSTSSMTSILSHFHFLLSAWRKPNFEGLSRDFEVEFESFTKITRSPAAAFAHHQDGIYAIDADKQFDTGNILSMLGKSMEKLLTLPKEDFEKYRRTRSHQLSEEEKNAEEGYHYTTFGDFMMRSQLDAHDPRLPGTGMFDLKTRAVVPIRMDAANHKKGVGYEIRYRTGQWESYEREYYDMVRSALLKYSLQVRMGRMDGIFVAFHNTQRIFGFQYVPLTEMDLALHGARDRRLGDDEFKASLQILNDLLDRATARFPGKSLRLHVETRETKPPLTYFFVEPVNDDDIARTKASGEESMEEAKSDILDLARRESEAVESRLEEDMNETDQEQLDEEMPAQEELSQHQRQAIWDEMMSRVDETVEDDSKGLQTVRDAIHEALNQSGLLRGKSDEEKDSYLNALVEALAADLPGAKDNNNSRDTQQPIEQDGSEKDDDVAVQNAESSKDTIHASVETDDSGVNAVEHPDEDVKSTEGSVPVTSLKDLILKVAQNVENKPTVLGVFEQVLSKLAAEAREVEKDVDREETTKSSIESTVEPAETMAKESAHPVPNPDQASATSGVEPVDTDNKKEVFGMLVTIQNKSKGSPVERITAQQMASPPQVEYLITELADEKAKKIYQQIKNRRRTAYQYDPEDTNKQWYKMWGGRLADKVSKGKMWRQRQDLEDSKTGLKVAWDKNPLPADAVHPTDPSISKE